MGENPQSAGVASELRPEEQAHLQQVLNRLEDLLVDRVLKRLRLYLASAATILTGFGVVSIASARSAAVDSAAKALASDPDVQSRVVEQAEQKLEEASKLAERSRRLATELEGERIRGVAAIQGDLDELLRMLGQIKAELGAGAAPERPVPPSPPDR